MLTAKILLNLQVQYVLMTCLYKHKQHAAGLMLVAAEGLMLMSRLMLLSISL